MKWLEIRRQYKAQRTRHIQLANDLKQIMGQLADSRRQLFQLVQTSVTTIDDQSDLNLELKQAIHYELKYFANVAEPQVMVKSWIADYNLVQLTQVGKVRDRLIFNIVSISLITLSLLLIFQGTGSIKREGWMMPGLIILISVSVGMGSTYLEERKLQNIL